MNITFEPAYKDAELFFDKPIPAIKALPDWYKHMPLTIDGANPGLNERNNGTNYTLKGCSPFLDSLGAGYIMTLPCDLYIKIDEHGSLNFTWMSDINDLVTSHDSRQVSNVPESSHNDGNALKWRAGWKVQTPRGYSTLFTHPLNRHELPFYTLSGIVETDSYKVATEFPFLMHKEVAREPFILPKGTPIIQAIPFKRDDWKAKFVEFDERENIKSLAELKSKIFRSYKKQFWIKKNFN